jgi:MFS family permease
VGNLTSLGWLIAMPIAGGIVAGWLLDRWLNAGHFWALALLGAGICVSALEMYLVIRSTLQRRNRP